MKRARGVIESPTQSQDRKKQEETPRLVEVADETDTLASYITDYPIENGRRYHAYKAGAYWGPNDEHAIEGHNLTHQLYTLTLNGNLHLAPLNRPREILDVGTGTGIWAIEAADRYPAACVVGTDLSPIQPDLVPPNCAFEIDDATLDWTWDEGHFDFVHVRELFGSIDDWAKFMGEALRCTRPGGWVEIVEHGPAMMSATGSFPPNHVFPVWNRMIPEISRTWGKPFDVHQHHKSLMEQAGFESVVERRFQWPTNGWPDDPHLKQLGEMNRIRLMENMEGYLLRILTGTAQWTVDRVRIFAAEMRNAVNDPTLQAFLPLTVVYGRKPR